MKRRDFLSTACGAAVLAAPVRAAAAQMQVLKSPTCGCCSAWVTHIKDAGRWCQKKLACEEEDRFVVLPDDKTLSISLF